MKCIYCAADTNYKARQGNRGACNSCHRRFAFEPKGSQDKLTDQKFQKVVEAVADGGSLKFTSDHLRYEFARRKATVHWLRNGVIVMIILFVIAILESSPATVVAWFAAIPLVFGVLRWFAGYSLRHAPITDVNSFAHLQSRWVQAHGPIPGLIGKDEISQLTAASIEPDPYYNFARVVVTDTRATAALLLANKFHIENECAVICIDGFPFSNWHDVVGLLRNNPDLEVALVHDATPDGCALPSRVRRPDWFPEETFTFVDVGLRPAQARGLNLPVLHDRVKGTTISDLDVLARKDVTTLEKGKYTELAALTPRRLMTSITRNFILLSAARSNPEMALASSDANRSTWFFGSDGGAGEEESFG